MSEAHEFDERVAALFAEAADEFDLIEERDQAFLNWRFCDSRGGRFTPLIATEGDTLRGYAVLTREGDLMILADLLSAPSRPDVVRALVEEALARTREADAAELYCWLPRHHRYRAVLMGLGFFDAGARSGVNVRPISLSPAERESIHDDARCALHILQGDTDAV